MQSCQEFQGTCAQRAQWSTVGIVKPESVESLWLACIEIHRMQMPCGASKHSVVCQLNDI